MRLRIRSVAFYFTAVIITFILMTVTAQALPTNTTPPSISGTLQQGQTLTATTGVWTIGSSPTYSYQWRDCNSAGSSCSNISGATAGTYVLTATDVAQTIDVVVTASDSTGSTNMSSPASAVVVGSFSETALASSNYPELLTAGAGGNLYLSDDGSPRGLDSASLLGSVTDYDSGLNSGTDPWSISANPSDSSGTVWFTDPGTTHAIGKLNPSTGAITEYSSGLNSGSAPESIAAASDGGAWFADPGSTRAVGHITSSGTITEYSSSLPAHTYPSAIAVGPDGNFWFLDPVNHAIAKITSTGVVTEYSSGLNSGNDATYSLVTGPDGNIWFTDDGTTPAIGKINPSTGAITEYSSGLNSGSKPYMITAGADGNVWFTDIGTTPAVGRITPAGVITEYTAGLSSGSYPGGIASGADGNIWFTDKSHKAIWRIAVGGPVNTSALSVSGTPYQGQVLTAHSTWTGTPTPTLGYQWEDCNSSGGGCTPISGATSSTYTLASGDTTNTVRVVLTASNSLGSVSALSAQTAVVTETPVNTALPTLSGTAAQGQTLTATSGSWGGYPTPTTSYQWQDCDQNGNNCTSITGATTSTYVLAAADSAHTVRVSVSATNSAGTTVAASSQTSIVTGPLANASAPIVSGSAQQGVQLSVSNGTWYGYPQPTSFTYQWQDCDENGNNCTSIAGATSGTYTPTATDVADTLRAVVTATLASGSTVSASSAATAMVVGAVTNFSLGSSNYPEELTTGSDGNFWFSDDGTTQAIDQITPGGVLTQFSSGFNAGSSPFGITTGPDGNVWFADDGTTKAIGKITSTGVVTEYSAGLNSGSFPGLLAPGPDGNVWFTDPGTTRAIGKITPVGVITEYSTGLQTHSYPWAIAQGPDGNLWFTDVGGTKSLGKINPTTGAITEYSAGLNAGADPQYAITAGPDGNLWFTDDGTTPAIGKINPTTGAITEYSAGLNAGSYPFMIIAGADGNLWFTDYGTTKAIGKINPSTGVISEYTSGLSSVGSPYGITTGPDGNIWFTDKGGVSVVAVGQVAIGGPVSTELPSVSGTTTLGQTLTAAEGTWTGVSPLTYAYQWQRCDSSGNNCAPISEATASTYVLAQADVGETLKVKVTTSNSFGSASKTTTQTAVVIGIPPLDITAPIINGATIVGQTLTASPGSWGGYPTPTYDYQWQACPVSGPCSNVGTGSSYIPMTSIIGETLQVQVTASNNVNTSEVTSAQTTAVGTLPANMAAPVISGTTIPGQVLSASTGTWTGDPTPTITGYQWQQCDVTGNNCHNISGEEGSTYTLQSSDAGSTFEVVVSASNVFGQVSASSLATAIVGVFPANSSLPVITGEPVEGQTLSASTGTWTGDPTPTITGYQWQDCDAAGDPSSCTAINGATSDSYVLAASDLGYTVNVIVTAENALGSDSATSSVTAVVNTAPVNTALPTVSGTVADDNVISAAPGAWTDISAPAYTYQWQKCDLAGEASSCSDIDGATSPTLSLSESEVGSTMRAVVTDTNVVGSVSADSATTTIVTGSPVSTQLPVVTGVAALGQTLSASEGGWVGYPDLSPLYQWESCVPNTNDCTDAGTSSTYTLQTTDVGMTVAVIVGVSNSLGSASATSASTAVVGVAPSNTAAPSISGTTGAGNTLASTTGTWTGTPTPILSYQWQRCNTTGGACSNISGATNSTYYLQSADTGHTIIVVVSGDNGLGSPLAVSSAATVVIGTAPTNASPPVINGAPAQGQVLSVNTGTWTGAPSPAPSGYQWWQCSSGCVPISGASNSTYTVQADDVGDTIYVVVTESNAVSSASAASAATGIVGTAPANTMAPSISGNPITGYTLSASPGSWDDATSSYTYQWRDCDPTGDAGSCIDVDGATSATYQLQASDIGDTVDVVVGAGNDVSTATASSPVTAVVGSRPLLSQAPTINGVDAQGYTLDLSFGSWISSTTLSPSYQWQDCDVNGDNCVPISGVTSLTYTLQASDVGDTVEVVASGENALGTSVFTSAPTTVVATPPVNTTAPSVSGTTDAGATLSADVGSWSGTPAPTYTYQWQDCDAAGDSGSCTNISGATGGDYTLVQADAGHTVDVVIAGSTSYGDDVSATSSVTAVVGAAPVDVVAPVISGEVALGQTVDVSTGSWTGLPAVTAPSYQWEGCDSSGNDCAPATGSATTSSTYTIQSSDLGETLKVVLSETNVVGSGSVTTAASTVVGAPVPPSSPPPYISGENIQGQTLTAEVGDWVGASTITYSYQWRECDSLNGCNNIGGANGDTLVLDGGNVGEFVSVVITADDAQGQTVLTTAVTAAIGNSPVNTVLPVISGDIGVGQTLSASTGTWVGTPAPTYSYQWLDCDASGNCVPAPGSTNSSAYTQQTTDLGASIEVAVAGSNFTDSGDPVVATSLPTAVVMAPPVNTSTPTISGDADVGQTLTVTPGTWSGYPVPTPSYQWQDCDRNGLNCNSIYGATGSTYVLTDGDTGDDVTAVVTETNAAASVTAAAVASSPVVAAPFLIAEPSLNRSGGTYTITLLGDFGISEPWRGGYPTPTASYQWEDCDATGSDCADIAGANDSSYTSQSGDSGQILAVVVTLTNAVGTNEFTVSSDPTVQGTAPVNTVAPSISGTVEFGQTLTADVGTWTGTPAPTFSYQWLTCATYMGTTPCSFDGPSESESDDSMYVPMSGNSVELQVTATNAYGSVSAVSAPTSPIEYNGGFYAAAPLAAISIIDDASSAGDAVSGTSLACPSAVQCTEVDAGGEEITFNPQTGGSTDNLGNDIINGYNFSLIGESSAPLQLDPTAIAAGDSVQSPSIACLSTTECVAAETLQATDSSLQGVAITFDPTTGAVSATTNTPVVPTDMVCESTNECTIIAADSAYTFDPEDDTLIDNSDVGAFAPNAIACASNTQCTVVDTDGSEVSFDPTTGSVYIDADVSTLPLAAVSCESSIVCTAVAYSESASQAYEVTFNADSGDVVTSDQISDYPLTVVVCASANQCTAADNRGYEVSFDPTTGDVAGTPDTNNLENVPHGDNARSSPDPYFTGLSCVSTVQCTLTDSALGEEATFNPGATPATGPSNVSAPVISGEAVAGQTLTASSGTWTGYPLPVTFQYVWQRCNTSSGCEVVGENSPTYVLTPADAGSTIEVEVIEASYSNGSVDVYSQPTAAVTGTAPTNIALPVITGAAVDGSRLTATSGIWAGTGGTISYLYQWEDCNGNGSDCNPISGASTSSTTGPTTSSYVLADSDLGSTIEVDVTATDDAGNVTVASAATAVVRVAAPANITLPAVDGNAVQGQTLYALPGTWSGGEASYKYQWEDCNGSDCARVNGATSASYVLQASDVGATVVVEVTDENASAQTTAESAPTGAVVAAYPPVNTQPPVISGNASEDGALTASTGTWSGTTPMTYAYTWERCGSTCTVIANSGSTYSPVAADVGDTIIVEVTATNILAHTTITSAATAVVASDPPTVVTAPVVSGSAVRGQTLGVSNGTWQGNGSGTISYSYQWRKCTSTSFSSCANITGATAATYTLTSSEDGDGVVAVVTASQPTGSAPATSNMTVAVVDPPTPDGSDQIISATYIGAINTDNPPSWSGSPTPSTTYQWQKSTDGGGTWNNVVGATNQTYAPTFADAGNELRLITTASNEYGQASTTSNAVETPASTTAPTPGALDTAFDASGYEPGVFQNFSNLNESAGYLDPGPRTLSALPAGYYIGTPDSTSTSIAVDGDDRVIAVGNARAGELWNSIAGICRATTTGQIDTTFGAGGCWEEPYGTDNSTFTNVAVNPLNNQLVVADNYLPSSDNVGTLQIQGFTANGEPTFNTVLSGPNPGLGEDEGWTPSSSGGLVVNPATGDTYVAYNGVSGPDSFGGPLKPIVAELKANGQTEFTTPLSPNGTQISSLAVNNAGFFAAGETVPATSTTPSHYQLYEGMSGGATVPYSTQQSQDCTLNVNAPTDGAILAMDANNNVDAVSVVDGVVTPRRYNDYGDLDTSYDPASLPWATGGVPGAILVLPDEGVLIAGTNGNTVYVSALGPDGALISSFGDDGTASFALPDYGYSQYQQPATVNSLDLDSNNDVVVGGGPATWAARLYGTQAWSKFNTKISTGPVPGMFDNQTNIASGNVYESNKDMDIPAQGQDIDFTRSYNSEVAANETSAPPLGWGWSFTYGESLTRNCNGTVTVNAGDGAEDIFKNNGDGSYTATTPGEFDTLVNNGDGTFSLTTTSGVVSRFDGDTGQLQSITDANGNVIELSYSGGKLQTITNESGERVLTVHWNGNHIQYIEDQDGDEVQYGYNSAGDLTSVEDPDGNITQYQYTPFNELKQITEPGDTSDATPDYQRDPASNQYFTYNNQGQETSSSEGYDPTDVFNYTAFAYDPNNTQSQVITAENITTYTYNDSGEITAKTVEDTANHSSQLTWGYGWDGSGDMTSETDPNGQTTQYHYIDGEVYEIDDPAPGYGQGSAPETKYSYNDTQFPALKTDEYDADGDWTHYIYNSHGDLTETDEHNTVNNNVVTTTYTYDPNNNYRLESMTAPQAGSTGSATDTTTNYYYDSAGDLSEVVTPDGGETFYHYTGNNDIRVSSVEEPNTSVIGYQYDADGNVTETDYPSPDDTADGAANTTSSVKKYYDPRGNLVAVVDQNGKTSTSTYNYANQPLTETDGAGHTSTYTYTDWGAASTTTTNGSTTEYGYDAFDRENGVTNGYGSTTITPVTTTYTLDGDGNIIQSEDGDGNITVNTYDDDDRLVAVKQGMTLDDGNPVTTDSTSTTSYLLDADGNTLAVTDGRGKTTAYTYLDNQVLTKTAADSSNSETNTYSAGYLVESVDPNGQETNYAYDGDGDLIGETFPGFSSPALAWNYNADGTLNTTGVGDATTTYGYDALARLISVTLPNSAGVLKYTYDLAGNRTSMILPNESTSVQYGYNSANQLNSLTYGSQGAIAYSYDPTTGLLTTVNDANGASETYSYDDAGRVSGVEDKAGGGSVITNLGYSYDPASNLHVITNKSTSATAVFDYNPANELQSEDIPAGFTVSGAAAADEAFAYDGAGNRTEVNDLSTDTDTGYGYNDAEELTSSGPEVSGHGSFTANLNYCYNADGELVSEQTGSCENPGSGLQEGFTYDPEGQLASATTTAGTGSGTTGFTYDINGNRIATTSPDGSTTTQVFDGSDPVQQTDTPVGGAATTTDYLYGADGVAELTPSGDSAGSSADYYYGHDGSGSITDLTDSSGDAASQYEYDAYGEVLGITDPVSQQVFGYQGNETDPTTTQATGSGSGGALDDFNAREYDPSLGQFLSPDPLSGSTSVPASLDSYSYGGDNPFSDPDPTGESWLGGLGAGIDWDWGALKTAYDGIRDFGGYIYDHPLAAIGITAVVVAGVGVCVFGGCEAAAAAAAAGAAVDATATGIDVLTAGGEAAESVDAGVGVTEGEADAVERAGVPTIEEGGAAEAENYTVIATQNEDGTYAMRWAGVEASAETNAEIGVADTNEFSAKLLSTARWTSPTDLPIPAGVKGWRAAVAIAALGADLYDELKNH